MLLGPLLPSHPAVAHDLGQGTHGRGDWIALPRRVLPSTEQWPCPHQLRPALSGAIRSQPQIDAPEVRADMRRMARLVGWMPHRWKPPRSPFAAPRADLPAP